MIDIRCGKCGKKLATREDNRTRIPNDMLANMVNVRGLDKDTTELGIKCPKCKEIKYVIV